MAAIGNGQDMDYQGLVDSLLQTSTVNFHHDAITGTHMPDVGTGYVRMIDAAYHSEA